MTENNPFPFLMSQELLNDVRKGKEYFQQLNALEAKLGYEGTQGLITILNGIYSSIKKHERSKQTQELGIAVPLGDKDEDVKVIGCIDPECTVPKDLRHVHVSNTDTVYRSTEPVTKSQELLAKVMTFPKGSLERIEAFSKFLEALRDDFGYTVVRLRHPAKNSVKNVSDVSGAITDATKIPQTTQLECLEMFWDDIRKDGFLPTIGKIAAWHRAQKQGKPPITDERLRDFADDIRTVFEGVDDIQNINMHDLHEDLAYDKAVAILRKLIDEVTNA